MTEMVQCRPIGQTKKADLSDKDDRNGTILSYRTDKEGRLDRNGTTLPYRIVQPGAWVLELNTIHVEIFGGFYFATS